MCHLTLNQNLSVHDDANRKLNYEKLPGSCFQFMLIFIISGLVVLGYCSLVSILLY